MSRVVVKYRGEIKSDGSQPIKTQTYFVGEASNPIQVVDMNDGGLIMVIMNNEILGVYKDVISVSKTDS